VAGLSQSGARTGGGVKFGCGVLAVTGTKGACDCETEAAKGKEKIKSNRYICVTSGNGG
jgi:hypothetical protein